MNQVTVTPEPATAVTATAPPAPPSPPVDTTATVKAVAETPKGDAVGDKILKERDEALAKLAEIQRQSEQAELDKAVQNKDVEALQRKFGEEASAREAQIKTLQQRIANDQRDLAVRDVVSELFMEKHARVGGALVARRLGATVTEKGEPELIVKDENGKPTKQTLEAFKKELQGDTGLAEYLKGAEVGSGSKDGGNVAPKSSGSVYGTGEPMLSFEQKFKAASNYRNASPTKLMEMAKARNRGR